MSKRPSMQDSSSKGKKQKTGGQTSMMNFFGSGAASSSSIPIDLTLSDNDNDADADTHHAEEKKSEPSTRTKTKPKSNPSKQKYKIFCDLDGVLADFDTGVKRINRGRGPDELNSIQMWASVNRADQFYLNLPWTADGRELWTALVRRGGYCPDILTGVPRTKRFRDEKFRWCKKELPYAFQEMMGHGHGQDGCRREVVIHHADYAGKKKAHERVEGSGMKRNADHVVNVITCHSVNKHLESGPGMVLIDDRIQFEQDWNKAGGIFIHHTDTESTIRKLVERGILPDELEPEPETTSAAALRESQPDSDQTSTNADVICIN